MASAGGDIRRERYERDEEVALVPGTVLPQRDSGASSGGQSGSDEGLSDVADADSESVVELSDEGQDYEAAVITGVERATDHEGEEVETEEAREDEILPEYRDELQPPPNRGAIRPRKRGR